MKKITEAVLLTTQEYLELTNPDKCYTHMTKTAAKKGVKNLLKATGFTCYHDQNPKPDRDDACCSVCPVMRMLGSDCGERMCERDKWYSK